jgi:hypothetical protein
MTLQNYNLQSQLTEISNQIHALSAELDGDTLSLLQLLRTLEALHREIQEGLFQSSLPTNRHGVYALLRDIEESGGWPYIERGKLQFLMSKLSDAETNSQE